MNPFRIRPIFSTALALALFFTTHAQTAQEIVAKHIEALGGKAKLQSINSVFIEGVSVLSNGTSSDTKLWKVYDRLYRQETSLGGSPVITIVTPSRGWICNGQGNEFKSLPSAQLRALQPDIDPAGALADDRKIVEHPLVGTLELDLEVLMIPDTDLRIVTYNAAGDTVHARKLGELRTAAGLP